MASNNVQHNVSTNFTITATSRRLGRLVANHPNTQPVVFRRTPDQSQYAINHRTGYAEAYYMQSVGTVNNPTCIQCGNSQGPFSSCRSVAGELNGACACCHWGQRAADCSLNQKRHDTAKPRKRTKKERKDKGKGKSASAGVSGDHSSPMRATA